MSGPTRRPRDQGSGLYRSKCSICHEAIVFTTEGGWRHEHSGWKECGTGDGASAYPDDPETLAASLDALRRRSQRPPEDA